MFHVEGQLFHVGLLTTDLDAGMDEIGRSAGVTWAEVRDWPMKVWLPDRGYIEMEIRLTFSKETQGPVRLELIQGSPDTPVDPAQGTGLHHFGYFVDDPAAETERLLALGGTLVMSAASPDEGYGRFTYVRTASGMLVEPVAEANRARFEQWWAGGELVRPASA
jgi:catechol 2,3-dioxygenase-like lactoylglutathione lyase family enzyme